MSARVLHPESPPDQRVTLDRQAAGGDVELVVAADHGQVSSEQEVAGERGVHVDLEAVEREPRERRRVRHGAHQRGHWEQPLDVDRASERERGHADAGAGLRGQAVAGDERLELNRRAPGDGRGRVEHLGAALEGHGRVRVDAQRPVQIDVTGEHDAAGPGHLHVVEPAADVPGPRCLEGHLLRRVAGEAGGVAALSLEAAIDAVRPGGPLVRLEEVALHLEDPLGEQAAVVVGAVGAERRVALDEHVPGRVLHAHASPDQQVALDGQRVRHHVELVRTAGDPQIASYREIGHEVRVVRGDLQVPGLAAELGRAARCPQLPGARVRAVALEVSGECQRMLREVHRRAGLDRHGADRHVSTEGDLVERRRDEHGVARAWDAHRTPVLGDVPGCRARGITTAPALRRPGVVTCLAAEIGVEEVDRARVSVVALGRVPDHDGEGGQASAPAQVRGHQLEVVHPQLFDRRRQDDLLRRVRYDRLVRDRRARRGSADLGEAKDIRERAPALGPEHERREIAVAVADADGPAHLLAEVDLDEVGLQGVDDRRCSAGDQRLRVDVIRDEVVVRVRVERVRAGGQLLGVGQVVVVRVGVGVGRERIGPQPQLVAVAHPVVVPVVREPEHGECDWRERDRLALSERGGGRHHDVGPRELAERRDGAAVRLAVELEADPEHDPGRRLPGRRERLALDDLQAGGRRGDGDVGDEECRDRIGQWSPDRVRGRVACEVGRARAERQLVALGQTQHGIRDHPQHGGAAREGERQRDGLPGGVQQRDGRGVDGRRVQGLVEREVDDRSRSDVDRAVGRAHVLQLRSNDVGGAQGDRVH